MNHACFSLANPVRRRAAGFTLIELMITVAIVGILAAVALPSYRSYIRRGQQPEAFNELSDLRTKMEQYYQDNRSYGATTCADTNTPAWATSGTTPIWGQTPSSSNVFGFRYFSFTCALSSSGQGYTITATASAGQVSGDIYTIDQAGNRATTNFKGATVTAACWLTNTSSC